MGPQCLEAKPHHQCDSKPLLQPITEEHIKLDCSQGNCSVCLGRRLKEFLNTKRRTRHQTLATQGRT